jgi:glutaminase
MTHTITFTPESISKVLNVSKEKVEEHWEEITEYINQMMYNDPFKFFELDEYAEDWGLEKMFD